MPGTSAVTAWPDLAPGPHPVGDGLQVQQIQDALDPVLIAGLRAGRSRPSATANTAPLPRTTRNGQMMVSTVVVGHGFRRIGSRQTSTRSRPATTRMVPPIPTPTAVSTGPWPAGEEPAVVDGTVVRLLRSATDHHHQANPRAASARTAAAAADAHCPVATRCGSAASAPGGVHCSTEATVSAPLCSAVPSPGWFISATNAMYSRKISSPTTMPRSQHRRLAIRADIDVDAALESTTHSIICTAAHTSATGSTDHGTPSAIAAPTSTIMLAAGKYPIIDDASRPRAASAGAAATRRITPDRPSTSTPNAGDQCCVVLAWFSLVLLDSANTWGWGTAATPPLVAAFTHAKAPYGQALACSQDRGRTWTLYADGRPVVPNQGSTRGSAIPSSSGTRQPANE